MSTDDASPQQHQGREATRKQGREATRTLGREAMRTLGREATGRLPRQSAILVTRDDRGRVLVVQQRGGPFKGQWMLPGGGLETGESFEDALHREVREETGLDLSEPRPIRRYDVRVGDLRFDVQMYAGRVSGDVRVGGDGEAVRWREVDPRTAHPMLLVELADAGLLDVARAELIERLRREGVLVGGPI